MTEEELNTLRWLQEEGGGFVALKEAIALRDRSVVVLGAMVGVEGEKGVFAVTHLTQYGREVLHEEDCGCDRHDELLAVLHTLRTTETPS